MQDGSGSRDDSRKKIVRLELDRSTIEKLQSLGPGWQDRLNEILRKALEDTKEG
jgi:uncharacterized protein (DUF4415 family)